MTSNSHMHSEMLVAPMSFNEVLTQKIEYRNWVFTGIRAYQ